jgi:hypothetical protein
MKKKINPLTETGSYGTKNTLSTNTDFLRFATEFLSLKMRSLNEDVNHCLTAPYAPFPAITFCLSIDLLGALILDSYLVTEMKDSGAVSTPYVVMRLIYYRTKKWV